MIKISRTRASRILLTLVGLVTATGGTATPIGREYEGDWYVSDTTDNNTGEREVYAFKTSFEVDLVSLRMRCFEGKPVFYVEWEDQIFPDQAVLAIGPVFSPDAEPLEQQYVFEKSKDVVNSGLRASPETSLKIIKALGLAKHAIFTAYLAVGSRKVGIDVAGTQGAWGRVGRHCPIQIMPIPPV